MPRFSKIFTYALSLIIVIAPPSYGARSVAQQTADKLLTSLQETNGVPGMSAAVFKNGELVWSGTAGLMDVNKAIPVNDNTRFRFASVSKLFAATLAAKVVKEGMLNPDAPIANYLPSLPQNLRSLTVKQLVSHTSGLPHYQAIDQGKTHGKIHYSSVTEALTVIGNRELLFKPGTGYHYSSHGYTLLSAVLEAVYGDSYRTLVEQKLTRPAGIHSIKAEDIRVEDRTRSEIYQLTANGAKLPSFKHDNSHSWSGAGKEGTAIDLAKFGMSVIDGSIVSAETLPFMQKHVTTEDGETVGRYYYRVGFGWRIGKDATGRTVMHHAGVTQGARSALVIYPEDGISVAILSNASWIASIERTASTIALPFIAKKFQQSNHIPQSVISNGTFGTKIIEGSIEANCRYNNGSITETGALSSYLSSMNHVPADGKTWPFFCAGEIDGSSYYGMSTPAGLVTFKAEDATTLSGVIGKAGFINVELATPSHLQSNE